MILAVDVTGDAQKFEEVQAACLAFEQARGEAKDSDRYYNEPLTIEGKEWVVLPGGMQYDSAVELPMPKLIDATEILLLPDRVAVKGDSVIVTQEKLVVNNVQLAAQLLNIAGYNTDELSA